MIEEGVRIAASLYRPGVVAFPLVQRGYDGAQVGDRDG
jgi:hypothetical protein